MADEIEEIRSRIDIVDLVGQRVNLKKTGKNYLGLCPFHDDKRPSFSVNSQLQRYRCWSCDEHGDIFTWVMKTQNMEFREALESLATQAGVTLSKDAASQKNRSERALHIEIMESANEFFRDHLQKSATCKEYLAGRGIDTDVSTAWELGYAPDVGEALAVHLKKKGYSLSLCRTLFLVEEDADGGYYDKFRGRLMFPIRDERNVLVAFGGRVLGDALPKYINSSDTPLYRKSRVLYGMNVASQALTKVKPRQAVLCEGYLDVIACHRAGVTGAVASLGTALSDEHAKMLKRWCQEVVVLYDADSAGQKAADRALEILKTEQLPAKVALMPKGDDPDTLLRREGPGAVAAAVKNATTRTSFRLDQIVLSHAEKDAQFWAEIANTLVTASDIPEIERHIERLVSQFAGVQDQLFVREKLREQILRNRRQAKTGRGAVNASVFQMRTSELTAPEAAIVSALLTPGLRLLAHEALIQPQIFQSEAGREFAEAYSALFGTEAPTGEPSNWVQKFDPKFQDVIQKCASDARFEGLSDRFIKDSVAKLRAEHEKGEIQALKKQEGPDRLSNINERLKRLKSRRVHELPGS